MNKRLNKKNSGKRRKSASGSRRARRFENDQRKKQKEDNTVDMKHLAPVSIVDMRNTWPRAIRSRVVHTFKNEEFRGPREANRVRNPFDDYYKTNRSGHFVWTDQNVVRHGTEVDRNVYEDDVYEANVEGIKQDDKLDKVREPSKRFDLKKVQGLGLGLFAKLKIEKHAMIGEYAGELINEKEFKKRELLYSFNNQVNYFYQTGTGMLIDANPMGNHTRYINHSCEPNCFATMYRLDEDHLPKVFIHAKKNIKKGEQLFLDYTKDYFYNMRCLCETDNCLEKTKKPRRRDSLFQEGSYAEVLPEERMNKTF